MNDKMDVFGATIIEDFRGPFEFLSNFYKAPFILWDVQFPTSEHAYQWSKTLDPIHREYILWNYELWNPTAIFAPIPFGTPRKPTTAGQSKRRGKEVSIRTDWEEVRYGLMFEVLTAKFEQNPTLMVQLKSLSECWLIEGNIWHDNVWGSCFCPKCGNKGQNLLGNALMSLRDK